MLRGFRPPTAELRSINQGSGGGVGGALLRRPWAEPPS